MSLSYCWDDAVGLFFGGLHHFFLAHQTVCFRFGQIHDPSPFRMGLFHNVVGFRPGLVDDVLLFFQQVMGPFHFQRHSGSQFVHHHGDLVFVDHYLVDKRDPPAI